jgi:hypothetical protein
MLSNLSDLLMSRVDPDPVKAQTAMVGMSPQSQAQAMQQAPAQQQVAAPQQAQFLNTTAQGKPGKTPQNVLDYLKSMEEGGISTPPGEVPAFLNEGVPPTQKTGQTRIGAKTQEYLQKYPGIPANVAEWIVKKEISGVQGDMPAWQSLQKGKTQDASTELSADKFNDYSNVSALLKKASIKEAPTGEPMIPGFESELKGDYSIKKTSDEESKDTEGLRSLIGKGFTGIKLYNTLLGKEKVAEYVESPEGKEIRSKLGRNDFGRFMTGKGKQIQEEVAARNNEKIKSLLESNSAEQ